MIHIENLLMSIQQKKKDLLQTTLLSKFASKKF